MEVISVIYLVLLTMALISGRVGMIGWGVKVNLHKLNYPYFTLGLVFEQEMDSQVMINKITMGFVFINIVVEYYRPNGLSDKEIQELFNDSSY